MYAIIRAGGKQSKVSEGDVLDVERSGHRQTYTTIKVKKITVSGAKKKAASKAAAKEEVAAAEEK